MYRSFKRLFDCTCAGAGLLLLSPLFAAIAVLIKVDSRGSVFYLGKRIGQDGIPFMMYKFRTMVTAADRIGASSTPEDDPRITRVGRMLRTYKLDELPQLINVFRGDMSLVGPRPQVEWCVHLYTVEQRRVLSVLPGITDYASLHFPDEGRILKGSADPDKEYMEKIHPEKMRLSLKYVEDGCFSLDLKILFHTIRAIAGIRGNYTV